MNLIRARHDQWSTPQGWRVSTGDAHDQASQHASHRHLRGGDRRGVGYCAVLAGPACSGTLAQYTANIQQLQTYVAKAQALADQNPLYIADVEYYASVLADAQHCAKSLGSVATANR